jgi:hypothetical protein
MALVTVDAGRWLLFNRDMLNSLLARLRFALLFGDYGSEFFYVPCV